MFSHLLRLLLLFDVILWRPLLIDSANSNFSGIAFINKATPISVPPSFHPWLSPKSLTTSPQCRDPFTTRGIVVLGESPGCCLFVAASMLEWLKNHLPHHSQGSSTERWSRNTLRVVTARVFYILWWSLTSPFILNNLVEMAAPFNVVSHPRYCEPRN